MQIALELEQARRIARDHHRGEVNVISTTRRPDDDTGSLDWWRADPGQRVDRAWAQKPRDRTALATYRDLVRHAVEPSPAEVVPTEFRFRDGLWGRPDKDIIKVGLRDAMLEAVIDAGRVVGFRITERGQRDLAEHGSGAGL
jgi:hypothetical protein